MCTFTGRYATQTQGVVDVHIASRAFSKYRNASNQLLIKQEDKQNKKADYKGATQQKQHSGLCPHCACCITWGILLRSGNISNAYV